MVVDQFSLMMCNVWALKVQLLIVQLGQFNGTTVIMIKMQVSYVTLALYMSVNAMELLLTLVALLEMRVQYNVPVRNYISYMVTVA